MTGRAEAPSWPKVVAIVKDDGSAQVTVNGASHPVRTTDVRQARLTVIDLVREETAAVLGRPVRVDTTDPDGQWQLIVHPDGHVDAIDAPDAGRKRRWERRHLPRWLWVAAPAGAAALVLAGALFALPEGRSERPPAAAPPAVSSDEPSPPAAAPGPEPGQPRAGDVAAARAAEEAERAERARRQEARRRRALARQRAERRQQRARAARRRERREAAADRRAQTPAPSAPAPTPAPTPAPAVPVPAPAPAPGPSGGGGGGGGGNGWGGEFTP